MAAQKVALITAGSAGLGAQIARVFAPDFRVVRTTFLETFDALLWTSMLRLYAFRTKLTPISRSSTMRTTPNEPNPS